MKNLPLFNWLTERGTGILLHPTCFPGDQGVGTLDYAARQFLDFLEKAKMKYWQVCPLGPTGFGDSPYQTFSAFAGNPYLIDLKQLVGQGLLEETDLDPFHFMPGTRTDFGLLYEHKWPVLQKAYVNFKSESSQRKDLRNSYKSFKAENSHWLEPYGLFMALKQHFGGRSWLEWPKQFRSYKDISINNLEPEILQLSESHQFYQYLFYSQWTVLKTYANSKGIEIIGDIPIFVSMDSVDVWSHPEYFQVDQKTFEPASVAGVPPDYFSETGQFWGNPLYNWSTLKKNAYEWWIRRFQSSFSLYDIVRIDHFRGFESYWSIPASAETAAEGKWVKGPGLPFFEAIKGAIPGAKIIAEDLGLITPKVRQLLKDTGLPGMAVFQFAFGGKNDNLYLPHNLKENLVVYPGTHDNDTTLGWYESADDKIKDHVRRYFDISGESIGWDFIRTAYRSVSRMSIVQLQDFLSLGSSARMNEPGSAMGNWQWRYQAWQLESLLSESAEYLENLSELYNR